MGFFPNTYSSGLSFTDLRTAFYPGTSGSISMSDYAANKTSNGAAGVPQYWSQNYNSPIPSTTSSLSMSKYIGTGTKLVNPGNFGYYWIYYGVNMISNYKFKTTGRTTTYNNLFYSEANIYDTSYPMYDGGIWCYPYDLTNDTSSSTGSQNFKIKIWLYSGPSSGYSTTLGDNVEGTVNQDIVAQFQRSDRPIDITWTIKIDIRRYFSNTAGSQSYSYIGTYSMRHEQRN